MKLPSLLHHIFNADSRKVGFGWWLFIVATYLLMTKIIDVNAWQACVIMATALIGGGTVADKYLKKNGGNDAPAQPGAVPASPVGQ